MGADPFVSSCSLAVINMHEKVAHARTPRLGGVYAEKRDRAEALRCC